MVASLVVLFHVLNSLLICLWVGWLCGPHSACSYLCSCISVRVCVRVCVCVFGNMGSDSGALFTHLH